VVCLEAPEWTPLPGSLRRELDGRSVYTRLGVTRYATAAQLSLEDTLVARARTQGAPRLPGELAARRLGANPALLQAQRLWGWPYSGPRAAGISGVNAGESVGPCRRSCRARQQVRGPVVLASKCRSGTLTRKRS
jgi:hypothetical protein